MENKRYSRTVTVEEQAFREFKDYTEHAHELCRYLIHLALMVFFTLPLIMLVFWRMTDTDKVVILLVWILFMFALAIFLIFVDFFDKRLQYRTEHLLDTKLDALGVVGPGSLMGKEIREDIQEIREDIQGRRSERRSRRDARRGYTDPTEPALPETATPEAPTAGETNAEAEAAEPAENINSPAEEPREAETVEMPVEPETVGEAAVIEAPAEPEADEVREAETVEMPVEPETVGEAAVIEAPAEPEAAETTETVKTVEEAAEPEAPAKAERAYVSPAHAKLTPMQEGEDFELAGMPVLHKKEASEAEEADFRITEADLKVRRQDPEEEASE